MASCRALKTLVDSSGEWLAPDRLAEHMDSLGVPGIVLIRAGSSPLREPTFSLVTAQPFLTFQSYATRCELSDTLTGTTNTLYGDPWRCIQALMQRFEIPDECDLPFPLGGCFGCWGYDLKHFIEPKLRRRAQDDLGLPDCSLGFYDSLIVFDHARLQTFIVCTGLAADGSRDLGRAKRRLEWLQALCRNAAGAELGFGLEAATEPNPGPDIHSSLSRDQFIERVEQAQRWIRSGDIYQVNLSRRLDCAWQGSPWDLFQRLDAASPCPFAAYVDCGNFQLASSSPEMFLRLSGDEITSRPIKGTRPRSNDPTRDAQLSYELQTSTKEAAELVMITDLIRNDLGKVCDFGSVHVPALMKLERYAYVQHLVSTVAGRLRPGMSHLQALASCFPGGSITGAPKFRAMEIIEELEPVSRGPYTGAIGYLGFNRESQLSIAIRTAVCLPGRAFYHTGAGLVADSLAADEFAETEAKALNFVAALQGPGVQSPLFQLRASINNLPA